MKDKCFIGIIGDTNKSFADTNNIVNYMSDHIYRRDNL